MGHTLNYILFLVQPHTLCHTHQSLHEVVFTFYAYSPPPRVIIHDWPMIDSWFRHMPVIYTKHNSINLLYKRQNKWFDLITHSWHVIDNCLSNMPLLTCLLASGFALRLSSSRLSSKLTNMWPAAPHALSKLPYLNNLLSKVFNNKKDTQRLVYRSLWCTVILQTLHPSRWGGVGGEVLSQICTCIFPLSWKTFAF